MENRVSARPLILSLYSVLWVTALAGVVSPAQAQPLPAAPSPDVLLSTRFVTPLGYEAALTRLGAYYQEQVGRILPLTFPEIAPRRHFEVWHDIFVFFDVAEKGMNVTLKRPTGEIGSRLVKTWMLDLAGRLEAQLPLNFKEEPALPKTEADLFASRKDLARAFQTDPGMKSIPTWEHAGLIVSAAPLAWIMVAPAGIHGVHRVNVEAETAAAARQLLTKLALEVQKPGIYGVYSEEAALDREVSDLVGGQSAEVAATASQAVFIPTPDQKYLESKVRAEPEMIRRTAAAQGQFSIRCRLDKAYRKVTIGWSELAGYVRISGRYEAEHVIGQGVMQGPKLLSTTSPPMTLRAKLPPLQPGAYRVRLDAEDTDGKSIKIDERTYWFDGKSFEEL